MIEVKCKNGFRFTVYGKIDIAYFDNGFVSIASNGNEPFNDSHLLKSSCERWDSIPYDDIESITGLDDEVSDEWNQFKIW